MLRFLLDSNILSEPIKPHPNPNVVEKLHVHQGEVAMPIVVWHELVYGVERMPAGRKKEYLFDYLNEVVYPSIPILPYDEVAAVWHARERARLEATGRPAPFVDGMIAAVAVAHELFVVTRNTADFADYEGIEVTNWFDLQ
ncbi:MAG: type II toxin-antitoxin system VapC family toxin [Rhodothermales bacterium]